MDNSLCPYCVKPIDRAARDSEHVFPSSWYPDDMVPPRLTVQSHRQCNREFKLVEERLLHVWGMCLHETHPASKGIGERVLRSMDPKRGRNLADARFRERASDALAAKLDFIPAEATGGFSGATPVPPEWGRSASGVVVRGFPTLRVRQHDVVVITQNLVRGMHRIHYGEALPLDYRIKASSVSQSLPGQAPNRERLTLPPGPSASPAFSSFKTEATSDQRAGAWVFVLWDQLTIHALVEPVEVG